MATHETQLSRRAFLRIGAGLIAAAPLALAARGARAAETSEAASQPVVAQRPLGRPISTVIVRETASARSKVIRRIAANQVFAIRGEVMGDGPTRYNPMWYRVDDGFVHSGAVQPVDRILNDPADSLPAGGVWGELTIPFTVARRAPSESAGPAWRHYFGNVFRVLAVVSDAAGTAWYRIVDGDGGRAVYVRADGVRRIAPEEFAPLSPDVPNDAKRIDVNIRAQTMTAYEGDRAVKTAKVATGRSPYATTRGNHRVWLKIPGQRMTGGSAGDGSFYDLPGISWVTYFTASGIAFHGTYWHNDYGAPRSHGCVNLLPEDAKWVFRWTQPPVSYDRKGFTRVPRGTPSARIRVV